MKRFMHTIGITSSLLYLFLSLSSSLAAELAGVTLSDKISIEGTDLVLNGVGLREATVFKVDVYVAGLYLEKKLSDVNAILADTGKKKLVLHFVRDVGIDKITKGWTDGFTNNVKDLAPLQERITTFNGMMGDITSGQTITLSFVGSKVQVQFNGATKGEIEGNDFQQALLSIWLGANPPNEGLKKGLLGK